jgi:hypothetical protein
VKSLSALRIAAWAVIAFSAAALFPQQLQHEVKVVNIEISTRVFKGDTFVDNLTINDFEVLENGKPQQIEAVYLIKKTDIKREEGKKLPAPQVSRQFVFLFEMTEYLPEIDKVLDGFFDKVILPGDSLIVSTPLGRYHLRSEALAKLSKEKIKDQLQGKLRRDISVGSSEYKGVIETLYRIIKNDPLGEFAGFEGDERMELYTTYLAKLESLRKVDEKGLIQFAAFLKGLPGQKYVYMFYQKESVPQYSPRVQMTKMLENMNDPSQTLKLMENFQFFSRDTRFDVEAVKRAYADSSIAIHFLYVTKTPALNTPVTAYQSAEAAMDSSSEVTMVERSEDIFSAFNQVAQATGGISDSSANASAAFQRAVNASENYYLIYYKPSDSNADGKFREIKVRVKTGNYRVLHRAGYFAN